ncbi:MAG: hypothetical protein CL678_14340 [Bdellovibrionaceae bacterium]|nr:hypothetical protein [Pseudobdellovibrionaceae bacterium]|tara:strand:- start:2021 stop:3814 length:1794 start_codon:yes stop_codon:yes gene_type:complete
MNEQGSLVNKKNIKCLVVQLGPLSDTIQSLMALRAAKQLYPNVDFSMVVRSQHSAAARRVDWLENVFTLPTEAIINQIVDSEKTIKEGMADLGLWLSPVVGNGWDFLVNWTYSQASSYLSSLIPAQIKLGYVRENKQSLLCSDGWSCYIHAAVQSDIKQNIHLTDILTTQLLTTFQIHLGEPEDNGEKAVTSKSFFVLDSGAVDSAWDYLYSSKKWICIHIRNEEKHKNWSSLEWSEFASFLLRRHPEYNIVITGDEKEKNFSNECYQNLIRDLPECENRVLSLVGETDFDLWTSIVGKCAWLVSSDITAVQLASVLGTRILHLAPGDVKYYEIGPYGNSHYVVTSNEKIRVEAAYAVWSYASSEWAHHGNKTIYEHFQQLGYSGLISKTDVLRTKIRSTQNGGGVFYERLIKEHYELSDLVANVIGQIARGWYCGWIAPTGQEINREFITPELIKEIRLMLESSLVLYRVTLEAVNVATELVDVSGRLKSDKIMSLNERDKIQSIGKKLIELDALIDRLAKAQPMLAIFAKMSQVLIHNLESEKLSSAARDTAEVYRQMNEGVAVLREWLEHTIEISKPVIVQKRPLQLIEGQRKL